MDARSIPHGRRGRTAIGTFAWGATSEGRLSTREAIGFAWSAWRTDLARWPRSLRSRFSPRAARALDAPPPLPDTPCTREALRVAQASCAPWVIEHAWRTSFWGHLFAEAEGRALDRELLHVAALLHDIALEQRNAACGCFAIDGARRADAFAAERGWSEARRAALGDAIALHMNAEVPSASSTEAHLLHAGAALDVLGLRLNELPRAAVTAVLTRHPRGDFAERFAAAMRAEAERSPRSRTALLVAVGFPGRITGAWQRWGR